MAVEPAVIVATSAVLSYISYVDLKKFEIPVKGLLALAGILAVKLLCMPHTATISLTLACYSFCLLLLFFVAGGCGLGDVLLLPLYLAVVAGYASSIDILLALAAGVSVWFMCAHVYSAVKRGLLRQLSTTLQAKLTFLALAVFMFVWFASSSQLAFIFGGRRTVYVAVMVCASSLGSVYLPSQVYELPLSKVDDRYCLVELVVGDGKHFERLQPRLFAGREHRCYFGPVNSHRKRALRSLARKYAVCSFKFLKGVPVAPSTLLGLAFLFII